jgi:photosystem I P700 chlorophyll a apoprotein A1
MRTNMQSGDPGQPDTNQLGGQLSIALAICGSSSVIAAYHLSGIAVYAFIAGSYPTVLCLFCHHMWIGGFLIVGAGVHASL